MSQFEATLEDKAMQWLSNYNAGYFVDYDALKIAFLNWFRKEKTPNEILSKLRDIKQKKMLVEDYTQEFNKYLKRLTNAERPTDEVLPGYFMNGLRKELRGAVVGVDIAAGIHALVETATRAEKRFGLSGSTSTTKTSKEKKKKKSKEKKKRKSKGDSSEEDSDSDSSTDSDDLDSEASSESSSDDDSDDDSDEETKKKKHKKKSDKKSKKKSKDDFVEKLVEKKLKELGVKNNASGKPVHCDICDKDGLKTKDCWYNPSF